MTLNITLPLLTLERSRPMPLLVSLITTCPPDDHRPSGAAACSKEHESRDGDRGERASSRTSTEASFMSDIGRVTPRYITAAAGVPFDRRARAVRL